MIKKIDVQNNTGTGTSGSAAGRRTTAGGVGTGTQRKAAGDVAGSSYGNTRAGGVGGSYGRTSSAGSSYARSGGDSYAGAARNSREARARAAARARKKREKRLKMILAAIVCVAVIVVCIILIVDANKLRDVDGLELTSTTETQTISWKSSKKDVAYNVYRAEGLGSEFVLMATFEDQENSFVSDGLTAGTMYRYKVTAARNDETTEGVEISGYTVPNSVENTEALTRSKDSLTIFWELEGEMEKLEVEYGTDPGLSDKVTVSFASSEVVPDSFKIKDSCQISGLTVGETYYFRVRTVCGELASAWSETFSGVVTKAVDMTGVDLTKKLIALTFDDGPDYAYNTDAMIEVLEKYDCHATFFMLGERCEAFPDTVKTALENGNEIGNHTYDHKKMGDEVDRAEIIDSSDAIEAACGERPTVFRSPGGSTTDLIVETCKEEGMPLVRWNVDSEDWSSRDVSTIVSTIQNDYEIEDGDILLFHSIYEETVQAMEILLPWLMENGYQTVTVSQLIQARSGEPPEPGTEYFSSWNYN